MKQQFHIAVFEGDGIGPEIMRPTVKILGNMAQAGGYQFDFNIVPAGATQYAQTGDSLSEASMEAAHRSDAILLSAMGLPSVRYDDGTEISPQIDLRKALTLFAGVRSVRIFPGQKTPLNMPAGKEVDSVLIRESTEGLFYTQGRGEVTKNDARETLLITRDISEKLFQFAFGLAKERKDQVRGKGRVTCLNKASVFRAFAYFREIFDGEAKRHTDIITDHAYVDATALSFVLKP